MPRSRKSSDRWAWRALGALLLAATCAMCASPVAPVPEITTHWAFVGSLQLSVLTCVDSMTLHLTQRGSAVRGETTDWRFACDGVPEVGPRLIAIGVRDADSIGLRWTTDSTHRCALCHVFTMIGHAWADSLAGLYVDHLGGAGSWVARLVSLTEVP